jgi:CRP-like cAMP-binding protein
MLKLRFFRRQSEIQRIGQIQRLGLFATLGPKELRVVSSLLQERQYLKGEIVFDEGEEGQALYVVLSGRVLICRQGGAEAVRIAEVSAGAMFGELALLDNAPRSAQVRAVEDCVLGVLSRADFNGLVETHGVIASKIALQLARELGQKLREHFLAMDARPL